MLPVASKFPIAARDLITLGGRQKNVFFFDSGSQQHALYWVCNLRPQLCTAGFGP